MQENNPMWRKMSVEEYLKFNEDSPIRYEYYEGYAVAMAGSTKGHSRLAANFERELNRRLPPDGSCHQYSLELQVPIPGKTGKGSYFYPDVVVACDEPDDSLDDTMITSPRLVVEVLSPSTERKDRGYKFHWYQTLPSLQEYVLVSARFQFVEIFRRQPDGQWSYDALRPDQAIELKSLGLEITFTELYARVPVPVKPTIIKEAPASYSYQEQNFPPELCETLERMSEQSATSV
jgi:Uma2 family endonuclease